MYLINKDETEHTGQVRKKKSLIIIPVLALPLPKPRE